MSEALATVEARAAHLVPLLAPRSIALVGASPKQGSFGNGMVRALRECGFPGAVYPVNPNYEAIEDYRCYPSVSALPERVDHVVLGVANRLLEAALDDALAAQARSATIFASGHLDGDGEPKLLDRGRAKVRAAGIPLCGGNCSGYANTTADTYIALGTRGPMPKGDATLITQSGSVQLAMRLNNGRVAWNLLIGSGQEIATSAADYMAFALTRPETRAIGLFLETVRDGPAFLAALEVAAERGIPIVAVKVGRSEAAARLAVSHSGAIAGNDAAYEAAFDRYGVHRVDDLDEMTAVLQMVRSPRRAARGALVALHDSGGERELLLDHADRLRVPVTAISAATTARLRACLEPGLEPVNPLDAWGTGNDYQAIFGAGFAALMDDENAAVGLWVADVLDGFGIHEGYMDPLLRVAATTTKPVAVATCFSKGANTGLAERLMRHDVPLLEGIRPALLAARAMLDLRDAAARPRPRRGPAPAPAVVDRWRVRLAGGATLDEVEGLALLADFGAPVVPHRVVETVVAAEAAARDLGFPVVLKTAMPGIAHKTEAGGVRLNLADSAAVARSYEDVAGRLGPRVMVAPMVRGGVELALAMVHDPTFGPIVGVGAGGTLVELMSDVRWGLTPLDDAWARRLIDRLACRRLLDGYRGQPAADLDSLAAAVARFAVIAEVLGPWLAEMDVNPVIAGPEGAVAIDALVVPRRNPA